MKWPKSIIDSQPSPKIKENSPASPRSLDRALEEIEMQISTAYVQCLRGFLSKGLLKYKRLRHISLRQQVCLLSFASFPFFIFLQCPTHKLYNSPQCPQMILMVASQLIIYTDSSPRKLLTTDFKRFAGYSDHHRPLGVKYNKGTTSSTSIITLSSSHY